MGENASGGGLPLAEHPVIDRDRNKHLACATFLRSTLPQVLRTPGGRQLHHVVAMKSADGPPRPSLRRMGAGQFQKLAILVICCSVFLILSHTFGGSHYPAFVPIDRFPKKIWQSWKVEPLRFEERDNERARSWTMKNPGHRYEVLTDENAMNYVEENFGPSGFNRPDIVSTYKNLNARIIQADLLRYLVMYVDGGVYTDIDVEAIRAVKDFIPKRYPERDVNMVIGVETDEPKFKDHPLLGSKAQSFCQWTFMCKPKLPVMMRLIDNILIWLHDLAQKQGKPISEIELDFDEVLSGTGPSAFTEAILAQMSADTGEVVTWETFHDLEESTIVGGVLVLPSEAMAAGTGHSQSGNHGGRAALVKHHFHASSWPSQHPRYKHPIYGEVEKCNWDMECVKLWDANTAFFAALPEEEQLKMIALKDASDKKSAAKLEDDPQIAPPAGLPPTEAPADIPDDVLDGILDSN